MSYSRIEVYTFANERRPSSHKPSVSAGDQLDAKVKALRAEQPSLTYEQAWTMVKRNPENARLLAAYAFEGNGSQVKHFDGGSVTSNYKPRW